MKSIGKILLKCKAFAQRKTTRSTLAGLCSIASTTKCAISQENLEKEHMISYLTDVEGNWDFFRRFIAISKVVQHDPLSSDPTDLCLRDNSMFIFGGDVCDKWTGDFKTMNALLKLKNRYPDRVIIILGNRDINKLRLSSELSDEGMKVPIDELIGQQASPPSLSLLFCFFPLFLPFLLLLF